MADFNFSEYEKDFNDILVVWQEIAKMVVPMFRAYREQGLSIDEAVALTGMFLKSVPKPDSQEEED